MPTGSISVHRQSVGLPQPVKKQPSLLPPPPSFPKEWAATEPTICIHAGTVLDAMRTEGDVESDLSELQEADARAAFSSAASEVGGLHNTKMLSKAGTRTAMEHLNLQLDDALFARLVGDTRWAKVADDSGRVTVDGFLSLYRVAFTPPRKYGAHLRKAASRGDLAIVKELLQRGCPPNTADGNGMTSLHHACAFGMLEVAKLLRQMAGASLLINTADNSGWSPLMAAASNGHLTVVRWLIEQGAQVNAANRSGRTALHIACSKGRDTVVKHLIAKDASIDARDSAGMSPLHMCALHGIAGCARILLEEGAHAGAVDELGHSAAYYGDEKVWKKLAEEARGGRRSNATS